MLLGTCSPGWVPPKHYYVAFGDYPDQTSGSGHQIAIACFPDFIFLQTKLNFAAG